jgi:UDP-N-acetylmuramate dehydrogenase
MDEMANIHHIPAKDAGLGYRKSMFMEQKSCILEATIKLNKGVKEEIEAKMIKLMELRKSKQPWELPSAGSVFKRPEGYFAGELIEECNLKGACVGGAEVSRKHAGFIVNKGNASFKDVESLVKRIQDEVLAKKGVKLECEIEFVS